MFRLRGLAVLALLPRCSGRWGQASLSVDSGGRALQLQANEITGFDPAFANCIPLPATSGVRDTGQWLCPTPGLLDDLAGLPLPLPSLPALPHSDTDGICVRVNSAPLFTDDEMPSIPLYYCGEAFGSMSPSPTPSSHSAVPTSGWGGSDSGRTDSVVFSWLKVYYVTVTIEVRTPVGYDAVSAHHALDNESPTALAMVRDLRASLASTVGIPGRAAVLTRVLWPGEEGYTPLSLFSAANLVAPGTGTGGANADETGASAVAPMAPSPTPAQEGMVHLRLRLLTSELYGCGKVPSACLNRTLLVLDALGTISSNGTVPNSSGQGPLHTWLTTHAAFFGLDTTSPSYVVEGQSVAGYGPDGIALYRTPVNSPLSTPSPLSGGGTPLPSAQGGIIVGIVVGSIVGAGIIGVGLSTIARRVLSAHAQADSEERAQEARRKRMAGSAGMPGTSQAPRKRLAAVGPPPPHRAGLLPPSSASSLLRTVERGRRDKSVVAAMKAEVDGCAPLTTVRPRHVMVHSLRRQEGVPHDRQSMCGEGEDVDGPAGVSEEGRGVAVQGREGGGALVTSTLRLHGTHMTGLAGIPILAPGTPRSQPTMEGVQLGSRSSMDREGGNGRAHIRALSSAGLEPASVQTTSRQGAHPHKYNRTGSLSTVAALLQSIDSVDTCDHSRSSSTTSTSTLPVPTPTWSGWLSALWSGHTRHASGASEIRQEMGAPNDTGHITGLHRPSGSGLVSPLSVFIASPSGRMWVAGGDPASPPLAALGGRQWLPKSPPCAVQMGSEVELGVGGDVSSKRAAWRRRLRLYLDDVDDGHADDLYNPGAGGGPGEVGVQNDEEEEQQEEEEGPQPRVDVLGDRVASFAATLPGRARDVFLNADAYLKGLIIGPDPGPLSTIQEQPSALTGGGTSMTGSRVWSRGLTRSLSNTM